MLADKNQWLIIIYLYFSSEGIWEYEKIGSSIVSVALKRFFTQQDEGIVHDAWYSINKIS